MTELPGRIGWMGVIFALLCMDAVAEDALTNAEAKMFAASAGYERFMGRWSRLLAPRLIAFAGVKNGDHVLDVGTGTGALASALEANLPASESPSEMPERGGSSPG